MPTNLEILKRAQEILGPIEDAIERWAIEEARLDREFYEELDRYLREIELEGY
jgi:hypothetical protein